MKPFLTSNASGLDGQLHSIYEITSKAKLKTITIDRKKNITPKEVHDTITTLLMHDDNTALWESMVRNHRQKTKFPDKGTVCINAQAYARKVAMASL